MPLSPRTVSSTLLKGMLLCGGLLFSQSTLKLYNPGVLQPTLNLTYLSKFSTQVFPLLDGPCFTIMLFLKILYVAKFLLFGSLGACVVQFVSLFKALANLKDNIRVRIESLLKQGSINNISDSKQFTIMEERETSILKQAQKLKWHNGGYLV